jgi:hypothetical protein
MQYSIDLQPILPTIFQYYTTNKTVYKVNIQLLAP